MSLKFLTSLRVIAFFLLFFGFTVMAFADQLIIEPDMGRKPIIDIVKNARHSIDLVMYGWTDEQMLSPFIQQIENNKSIKIVLEDKPYKMEDQNTKVIHLLKKNHIDWIGNVPPFRLIHQKTLIIDDNKALVMTFNFTKSTFKSQRNFALLIDDPKMVNEIANVFSADWNHVPVSVHSPDLIYSPNNSREQFIRIISSAKKSINIYAQDVSDQKIVNALASTARRGVEINILTSKKLRDKAAAELSTAGVTLHYNTKLYIHAKALTVDNSKAVIGSVNFTSSSFDNNRELAVITRDPSIIRLLNEQFAKDIQRAERIKGNRHSVSLSNFNLSDHTIRQIIRVAKQLVRGLSSHH